MTAGVVEGRAWAPAEETIPAGRAMRRAQAVVIRRTISSPRNYLTGEPTGKCGQVRLYGPLEPEGLTLGRKPPSRLSNKPPFAATPAIVGQTA